MIVLGLTGGIATGKSTLAAHMIAQGIPVFDADSEVHRLLQSDETVVTQIKMAFPDAVIAGVVDRKKLGAVVFADDEKLKILERIIHPAVRHSETLFLEKAQAHGAWLAVLDIPLLFETGAEKLCDAVLTTDCSEETQRERVMQRPNMTEQKRLGIKERQMSRAERRARADYVISTDQPVETSLNQLDGLLSRLKEQSL